METKRPKIGVALSGASARAVAHIGVLEVFKENNIPVDIIVGCSSGAMVAASYATETMEQNKKLLFNLSMRPFLKLFNFWNAPGALGTLNNKRADNVFNQFTKGLKFEDLPLKVGFTATDIQTAELVTITSGDLNEAFRATVAVPGLISPVVMDNRVLVDGGLVNIVPTIPARQMGADIVIGINLAATRFIYEKKLPLWRAIRFFRKITGIHLFHEIVVSPLTSKIIGQINGKDRHVKIPNMFRMVSWAVDHSFDIEKTWTEEQIACDLMIEPTVKHFGKLEFKSLETIYEEGRKEAVLAVPKIKQMIADFEAKHREPEPVMETQRN